MARSKLTVDRHEEIKCRLADGRSLREIASTVHSEILLNFGIALHSQVLAAVVSTRNGSLSFKGFGEITQELARIVSSPQLGSRPLV